MNCDTIKQKIERTVDKIMLGLGTLFLSIALGGSAIKCGLENRKMMSKPFRYLDDGTPVYLDRLANEHANGEKIISKYNYQLGRVQQVGEISGRVYSDPVECTRKRMDAQSEKYRQEAIANGKLAYMRYDHVRQHEITCEVSTNKFIAYLEGRKDGTYWKYYLPANVGWINCQSKPDTSYAVEITQEEFDKLNIYFGTHSAFDSNRDKHQYYRHSGRSEW